MKILGNRVLVSRVEEAKAEGFTTVDVQDSFVYKGRVEQIGRKLLDKMKLHNKISEEQLMDDIRIEPTFKVGDVVLFAKYSPDTQEVPEGKIINVEDILAVYE